MKTCICKLYLNDGIIGTGFFCRINSKDETLTVLITNNHVIDEDIIKRRQTINLTINNDKLEREISFRYKRKFYTNKTYDVTIIEIIEKKDGIYNFLNLDNKINRNNFVFSGRSIYNLHYPQGKYAAISFGEILGEGENIFQFKHSCSTTKGSSGSPILDLETNDVIGIHNFYYISRRKNYNGGIFLKHAIMEFKEGINHINLDYDSRYFINLYKCKCCELQVNVLQMKKNLKRNYSQKIIQKEKLYQGTANQKK